MSSNSILEGLTPSQREAVTTAEGPLLILAGAGSGKTKVITHRTAYLMSTGVDGHRILCLTFTNKAAGEMKERVFRLLNLGHRSFGYGVPFLSTFHSFCLWVLRRFADRIGYPLDFTVIDDTDQLGVIKEVMSSLGLDVKRYSPKGVISLISERKSAMMPTDAVEDVFPGFADVYRAYQRYLFTNALMDFDDLLINVLELLRKDHQTREFLHNRFTHVMVDEYQDTNRIQYLIVKMLSEKHRNLCVVGDDDQSIYSWRGADIRNILDFERDFPDAKVVRLEENFRSTQTILDAAWHVVRNNLARKEKRLRAVKEGGEPVKVYVAVDERDEAVFVASEIERLGRPYNHYAVFYRTNAQSRAFEEELTRRGIPYVVVGGLRFYERKEIKDIVAYLRLIKNPHDVLSFKRIVNVPSRGIGPVTVSKVLDYINALSLPLWDGLKRMIEGNVLGPSPKKRLASFVELIEELRTASAFLSLSELVELVIEKTGYRDMLEQEGSREAEGRLENLEELVSVASDYDDTEDGLSLFLDRVALATSVDEVDVENSVTLMTLHSSKGLEFPVVFITGLEEGLLPHYRSDQHDQMAIEEERRLCYVGMTRAKELLYMTRAQLRRIYGVSKERKPSRFLDEIPEHLKTYVGESRSIPEKVEEKIETEAFSKGDFVEHPHFGKGRVIEVRGAGDSLKVKVRFYKYGVKLIKPYSTNLRKVG